MPKSMLDGPKKDPLVIPTPKVLLALSSNFKPTHYRAPHLTPGALALI